MSTYLNFNGQCLVSGKALLTADNRGFRYGDGLFETMKVADGRILLGDHHFERLFAGARLLQFDLPDSFTASNLSSQVLDLCGRNNLRRCARVRLVVFRGEGGLYDRVDHSPNYIIQTAEGPAGNNQLNEQGLVIGLFPDGRKTRDGFSHLKSNNFLLYVMAALYAQKRTLDDAVILNEAGRICESTIANIFCIKGNIISTPALAEGCVAGVMRRYLLENLPRRGWLVRESAIEPADLEQADEVFLTNALHGIRWVRCFRDTRYGHERINEIHPICLPQ